jgi:hypothetical protein
LLVSPAVWRRFFRPRYRELIRPVKQAGKRVFFHSCGMVRGLLDDLAELGVDAIWPQVALFNARQLAQRCRSLGMAVAIHPDRSHLMTTGRPEQVRESVLRLADEFQIGQGGSWFYVEIDNGFPFGINWGQALNVDSLSSSCCACAWVVPCASVWLVFE